VTAYGSLDPVSRKRLDLVDTVPAGQSAV
jgi:hypothetical protein